MTDEQQKELRSLADQLHAKGVDVREVLRAKGFDPNLIANMTGYVTPGGTGGGYYARGPQRGMRGSEGAGPDDVAPDALETRNATLGGQVLLHHELANVRQWENASAASRDFVRGLGDATTLGIANRIFDTPGSEQQDARQLKDSRILNKARGAGNVVGSFVPVGAAGLAGRAASKVVAASNPLRNFAVGTHGVALADTLVGKALTGAAEGALGSGLTAGGQELVRTQDPEQALRAGLEAVPQGAQVGGAIGAAGALGGATANKLRAMAGPTGEDIRITEQYGGRPSPVPFRPVAGQAASRELGVTASPAGRGLAGEQAVRGANEALDVRQRFNQQRLDSEIGQAMERHGGQQAPIDSLMSDIQGMMGDKALKPGTVGQLDALGKELEAMNQPQSVGTAPTLLDARGAPARADVAPAGISVRDLHGFKQRLDDMAKAAKGQGQGYSQDEAAFLGLSNRIRDIIRNEAPAVSLADRRYAGNLRKTEATRKLLPTGTQAASQGELTKGAGTEVPDTAAVRRQFPPDAGYDINRQLDMPRRVLAEERLGLSLPTSWRALANNVEPVAARGIYPAGRVLEGLSPGELAIQSNLLTRAANRRRQMEGR